ncbi:hypothetical protein QN277_016891 [Acacia crassicarpa]|uniref:Uncharacterized protein n=1 Tax=Acacia crassicarpa TaxID=499986 RepID=A0AAE1TBG1_9FABA|nr:hypothetical protein QN277_016890 [Acacia crassicarpa]KAK4279139.1 hypothetical protein QN277_016891 [Acacia crassicarpa]
MESDSDAVNRASLIISFCHLTSASHDEALFFLESHNFDLDAALSSFFNNSTSPSPAMAHHVDPKNPSGSVTGGTSTLSDLNQPPTDTTYDSGQVTKKNQMSN